MDSSYQPMGEPDADQRQICGQYGMGLKVSAVMAARCRENKLGYLGIDSRHVDRREGVLDCANSK